MKSPLFYFVLAIVLFATSCQQRLPISLHRYQIDTANHQFKHLLIRKTQPNYRANLHVYIEGDGTPFQHRYEISTDPTPINPLALKLMALDSTESIYLGRPCYFNQLRKDLADVNCSSQWWTSGRYSRVVIDDMVVALRAYAAIYKPSSITLIGYSGGGTIAMLMAKQMPEVTQLVTVAGNLDTDAWAALHQYSQLNDSLNPANEIHTLTPQHQWHFVGEKDENIPAFLTQNFLKNLQQEAIQIPGADHQCCWVSKWPTLLKKIDLAESQVKTTTP